MPTSKQSFEHVKGILAKLDRSIDDARQRRLHDDEEKTIGADETTDLRPGRAKPMQRESFFKSANPHKAATEQWNRLRGA
jgi:hypothetical protein